MHVAFTDLGESHQDALYVCPLIDFFRWEPPPSSVCFSSQRLISVGATIMHCMRFLSKLVCGMLVHLRFACTSRQHSGKAYPMLGTMGVHRSMASCGLACSSFSQIPMPGPICFIRTLCRISSWFVAALYSTAKRHHETQEIVFINWNGHSHHTGRPRLGSRWLSSG